MRRLLIVLAAGLVGVAFAVPAGADAGIKVHDSYFTPHFRVLVTGEKVTWTVEGSQGHTITSYPGSGEYFDSSPQTVDSCEPGHSGGGGGGLLPTASPSITTEPDCLEQGETFSHTFKKVGKFDYYCKVHGNPKVKPRPNASVGSQPCGMCGRVQVKVPSTASPAKSREPSSPGETSTPTQQPTESGSPSESPNAEPSLVADPAAPGGGGSAMTGVFAALAIALLSGLGYLVWRRYLQPDS